MTRESFKRVVPILGLILAILTLLVTIIVGYREIKEFFGLKSSVVQPENIEKISTNADTISHLSEIEETGGNTPKEIEVEQPLPNGDNETRHVIEIEVPVTSVQPKPVNTTVVIDWSKFLNSHAGKKDFAIVLTDLNKKQLFTESKEIAKVYEVEDKTTTINLFKSSFLKMDEFNFLEEGDSDLIEAMNLSKYADYIVIGTFKNNFRSGTEANGAIVCTVTMKANIISTKGNTIVNSYQVTAKGNGGDQVQALDKAKRVLYYKLANEYSIH